MGGCGGANYKKGRKREGRKREEKRGGKKEKREGKKKEERGRLLTSLSTINQLI
jgi:hypothetical protein